MFDREDLLATTVQKQWRRWCSLVLTSLSRGAMVTSSPSQLVQSAARSVLQGIRDGMVQAKTQPEMEALLRTVLKRKCYDAGSRKLRDRNATDAEVELADALGLLNNDAMVEFHIDVVDRLCVLAELPRAVTLMKAGGVTETEIAETLELSRDTVKHTWADVITAFRLSYLLCPEPKCGAKIQTAQDHSCNACGKHWEPRHTELANRMRNATQESQL